MLWQAILVGSKFYHLDPRATYYDRYLSDRRMGLWTKPDTIPEAEVERLILFLNQWNSHYDSSPPQRRQLLQAIRSAFPLIEALGKATLLTIDLSTDSVRRDISLVFQAIASCGSRYEATAASKILHTIKPELFVMWDNQIQGSYACDRGSDDYASRFLPRMQKLVLKALGEYATAEDVTRNEAERALTPCGHTLAKVIDEFNFAKFTLKRDEVWDAELSRC
jgi:hypothetical protein